jgi:hypothetical protein
MTEFLLLSTALAVALFYHFFAGESVVSYLLRMLMRVLRVRTFLISIL